MLHGLHACFGAVRVRAPRSKDPVVRVITFKVTSDDTSTLLTDIMTDGLRRTEERTDGPHTAAVLRFALYASRDNKMLPLKCYCLYACTVLLLLLLYQ